MADEKWESYTYKFGCDKLINHPGWLVQSSSKSNSSQEALALDNEGEPVIAHYYQKQSECTLEVVIPKNEIDDLPEIGKRVKYNGVGYYISSVQITENNTDFVRYSVSLKRFIAHGLPGVGDCSESL